MKPSISKKTQAYLVSLDGIGLHWPDIDEDLSLRGFLEYELAHVDRPL